MTTAMTAAEWDRCLDRVGTAAGVDPDWPWALTRCWLLVCRHEELRGGHAELWAAIDAFDELPVGVPGRTRLAAFLVMLHLGTRTGTMDMVEADRIAALSAVADSDPLPLEGWPADRAAARARWLTVALAHQRPDVDARAAQAEMDGLAAAARGSERHAGMVETARLAVRHFVARDAGDVRTVGQIADDIRAFGAKVTAQRGAGAVDHTVEVMATIQELQATFARGDAGTAGALVVRLEQLRAALPPQDVRGRQTIDHIVAMSRTALGLMTGPADAADTGSIFITPDVADPRWAQLRARLADPTLEAGARPGVLAELGGIELAAGGEHLDGAVEHFREAAELVGPTLRSGITFQTLHGAALLLRYEERRKRADLRAATEVLERARERAGGPEHPCWDMITVPLGHTYRLAGRKPQGNATGRSALTGHLRSVLLQSGSVAATATARHAAEQAVDVARWHLTDGDAAGAALALDAGRGLVLRSAIQFGDVTTRLTEAGAAGLAERWHAADGADKAPAELRGEVLAALEAAGGPALDPPEHDEVRAALARLGLDALVYLVSGDDGVGAAVIVPAHDAPEWVPLPRLNRGSAGPLESYLAADVTRGARGLRDMTPTDAAPVDRSDSVHDVCGWAWDVAVGQLLTRLRRSTARGAVPRLALVAMGSLARVPWHAARDGNGRFAVEQAVITYAVSARALCDTAWARPVALTPSGLVVGDPDTRGAGVDLPGARSEALAIRQRFLTRATYVGRELDGTTAAAGPGGSADIRAWLADGRLTAGTVLHAACHGVTESVPGQADTAYLLLAGGERLTAEELVRALGSRRELALVVLAACSSGVPGRFYDEAFSLSTAFLVAGARSVVSTLWPVSDAHSSVLMFMFHHFLRELPPLDALRAAQLWMLDPGRAVPVSLPESLRRQPAERDPAAWAAFTHQGR